MKKSKISILIVILLGLMFSPLFFGCDNKIKINLTQPTDVAYQLDEETGKELLVTEYNKYASSYVFGISESYDGEDTSNFLRYEVPATYTTTYNNSQVEVPHNFLDVTNIFKNARTYYYYAQYKGSGNFVDSEISPVRFVSITQKLATPFLSLAGGNLTWTRINNATNYSVYALINGSNVFVATTSSLEYDVSHFIDTQISNGLNSEIQFFVYCNSSQNYTRSADSNYVLYSAHLYLKAPTNVVISTTMPKKLSWSVVKGATTYNVCINNLIYVDIDSTKYIIQNGKVYFDVSEYYNSLGLGDYEFKVKANANGNFIESSYSNIAKDTYKEQLSTPQNVRCIDNYGNIEITWEIVPNAKTYVLEFSDVKNGYKIKKYNPTGNNGVSGTIIHNSVTLTYSELGITSISTIINTNFVVRVKAEGYNYYTDSQYSTDKTVVSKNKILLTPYIIDDEIGHQLSWSAISGAIKYEILIEYNKNITQYFTTATYFDYVDYDTQAGNYIFKCKAIANDEFYNSSYSNEI